jgi:hypothetical protein
MALRIRETVGIYFVNPQDYLYKVTTKAKDIKKFIASIKQPYTIRKITVPFIHKVKLADLAPLNRSLNIVIIPTRTFYFNLMLHSGHIVVMVSLDTGDPKYSHGIYVQPLSLISRFLGGLPVGVLPGSLYRRLKPEGKAIIVACMTDIEDTAFFVKIYKRLLKIKLDRKIKSAIIKILLLKRYKYQLHSKKEPV